MTTSLQWNRLPSIPDREGYASTFAGVSGDALLVAGGANFRSLRPWEGGKKSWYDSIFVLTDPKGVWKTGFRLPRPVAYGVSVTATEGVICIGGGDAQRHFTDVFRLEWKDGAIHTTALPFLPKPCAFMCGALVGRTVYIVGGIECPDATQCLRTLWALDLDHSHPQWQSLEPCPGPERMLAVAGAVKDSLYVFGGTRLSAGPQGTALREYLHDAWRFTRGQGWRRLADLPRGAVAAASPAPVIQGNRLLVVSGDDGSKLGFKPETQHPGFPRDVLAYDPGADRWQRLGEAPFSRATVATAVWNGGTVFPNGEARPGYRTPEVWQLDDR
jgi:N-acetylneuraminic acid mutarotase